MIKRLKTMNKIPTLRNTMNLIKRNAKKLSSYDNVCSFNMTYGQKAITSNQKTSIYPLWDVIKSKEEGFTNVIRKTDSSPEKVMTFDKDGNLNATLRRGDDLYFTTTPKGYAYIEEESTVTEVDLNKMTSAEKVRFYRNILNRLITPPLKKIDLEKLIATKQKNKNEDVINELMQGVVAKA